jgi:hypothetical protein
VKEKEMPARNQSPEEIFTELLAANETLLKRYEQFTKELSQMSGYSALVGTPWLTKMQETKDVLAELSNELKAEAERARTMSSYYAAYGK